MATITIRQLDETTKKRLRMRAANHGRSMEEEAREILKSAVAARPARALNLVESIRRRLEPLGFVDLPEVPREPLREPPPFDK
jgi:plasmid stability protein